MKMLSKLSLVSIVALSFLGSSLNAGGWVIVNENGTTTPYTADCCHAYVKRVVHHKKKKKVCKICDMSKYPEAKTMPLEPGEKLAPATLRGCPNQR